jgi:hypothetical protein
MPMGFLDHQFGVIHLMFYECKFIQILATLGRVLDMEKFKYPFKSINDIYWINIGDVHEFLDPIASKDENKSILDLFPLGCENQIRI